MNICKAIESYHPKVFHIIEHSKYMTNIISLNMAHISYGGLVLSKYFPRVTATGLENAFVEMLL